MTHPARGGLTRRRAVTLAAAAATLALHRRTARAASPGDVVRIGVLSDMNGPFADQVGPGSVAAARLAAEDFAAEANGLKVEVLSGDHQNKPDIGVGIARHWVDVDGVGAVVDLPNSAVALAVSDLMREKRRVALCSSSASSDITGKACAATTVQWVLDTWSLGHSTANALLAQGAKDWFFLTVDYALGHTLERDTAAAVTAGGGRVLGSVLQPLGTAGFSAALLQAQASGANVLALANTGADAINAIKQAGEFGLTAKMRVAALFLQISDVHAIGLPAAQGLLLTEGFYWDQNDRTRAWSKRFGARMGGRMPTEDHAGVYSASLAYLRAVRDGGTLEGEQVVRRMRSAPIADPLFGTVQIRADGRAVHAMYLFRVKRPADTRGPWDCYDLVHTIGAADAFRPIGEGGCKLVPA